MELGSNQRRFDCGPVLHAHEKTPTPEKVIAADLPQCGRYSALTGIGLNRPKQIKGPHPIEDATLAKTNGHSLRAKSPINFCLYNCRTLLPLSN